MRWLLFPMALLSVAATPATPAVELSAAKRLLPTSASCEIIPCLIEQGYRADAEASRLALELFEATGDVAGVGEEQEMDGGFRGHIHLVPQLPINGYRKHLLWVSHAATSMDQFFDGVFAGKPAPNYRWRALEFRFVRSLVKHRPSAYADDWTITYNVEGSLNLSEKAVRETLFHEIYHLNDDAHGDWSAQHLSKDYRAILTKCGAHPTLACLAPYAPNDTTVRGGTYYAFQQNNGNTVHEYAAELAVRYFKEQTEMRANSKLSRKAFKCGPPENARAWNALVGEFFGGRDLTPACRAPAPVRSTDAARSFGALTIQHCTSQSADFPPYRRSAPIAVEAPVFA